MKNNKAFPKFKKHLSTFIKLSVLVFFAMFFFSLLYLIFDRQTEFLDLRLPNFIHYLGIFISAMMMVMGGTYLKLLKHQEA
ncbi:MAG: hypothetical protein ACJAV6_000530 [Candidatus Paceibacteria bacterium]|jgi:hypothetical protein